jgi:Flp pilus assembly protein TadG
VEFAIVVPLLLLLLCGMIDFGLIFGGDLQMASAVATGARSASLNNYQYNGAATCTGGLTTDTADMVCSIVAGLGSLTGVKQNTVSVGICFVTLGSTPGCSGASAPGTSVTNDVEVCAQAVMNSTTGLTSVFISGQKVSTSSRLLVEEPQPSGATAYDSYNASSVAVDYNGRAITGLNCA